jgi:hypothetical protein
MQSTSNIFRVSVKHSCDVESRLRMKRKDSPRYCREKQPSGGMQYALFSLHSIVRPRLRRRLGRRQVRARSIRNRRSNLSANCGCKKKIARIVTDIVGPGCHSRFHNCCIIKIDMLSGEPPKQRLLPLQGTKET